MNAHDCRIFHEHSFCEFSEPKVDVLNPHCRQASRVQPSSSVGSGGCRQRRVLRDRELAPVVGLEGHTGRDLPDPQQPVSPPERTKQRRRVFQVTAAILDASRMRPA